MIGPAVYESPSATYLLVWPTASVAPGMASTARVVIAPAIAARRSTDQASAGCVGPGISIPLRQTCCMDALSLDARAQPNRSGLAVAARVGGDPGPSRLLVAYRRPSLREHSGQAPHPWPARTRSATMICCSRVARSARGANWPPPKPVQVAGRNWSPPKNPFPVLIRHCPLLSHWASLSHTVLEPKRPCLQPATIATSTTATAPRRTKDLICMSSPSSWAHEEPAVGEERREACAAP